MGKGTEVKYETAVGPASSSTKKNNNQSHNEKAAGAAGTSRGQTENKTANTVDKTRREVKVRIPVYVSYTRQEPEESETFYVNSIPFKLVVLMEQNDLVVMVKCHLEEAKNFNIHMIVKISAQPYVSEDIAFQEKREIFDLRDNVEFSIETDLKRVLRPEINFLVHIKITNLQLMAAPSSASSTAPDNSDDRKRQHIIFLLVVEKKDLQKYEYISSDNFYLDSKKFNVELFYGYETFKACFYCREPLDLEWSCRMKGKLTIVSDDGKNNVRRTFGLMFSNMSDTSYELSLLEDLTSHAVYGSGDTITVQVEMEVTKRAPLRVQYL